MEKQEDMLGMLDLLTAPGFLVKQNKIIKVNSAAAGLFFAEGMDILPFLHTGAEEYGHFSGGALYLSLLTEGQLHNASVTRQGDMDVFVLDADASQPELQTLALAARELRAPLSNAMLIADQLLEQQDPALLDQVSRLNRGLYQLLRIIGNMSDAGCRGSSASQTIHEIGAAMAEIFQKAQPLAEASGMALHYEGLSEQVFTLCDPEKLERAVLNMLSNAVKFSPKGGTIRAAFTLSGQMLRLSIQDGGTGIEDAVLGSIFTRYLRQPAIEDSRFGLGLGMVLIRNTAVQHGGTVLIDQPDNQGTRITVTLAIRQEAPKLSSRIIRPVSSGYDPGLIEMSEVLPANRFDGTR